MADERESSGHGAFERWMDGLEARHLGDLRFPEVSRAVRALSSAYVERRGRLASGAALDGAGKRAAFALFYGPLHFLLVRAIVRALDAARPAARVVGDLGCGTGAAGAAWALECAPRARVAGIERHPWAAGEARRSLRALGLDGHVLCADLARAGVPLRADAIVVAFTLNELGEEARVRCLRALLGAHARGARVLVVEPLAAAVAPWWPAWASAAEAAGGRQDQWRFPAALPDLLARLDRAAGLDHRELTARSVYLSVR
ncbi:MAG TPA: class I SAM-dependent methyltransferase [Vicinamibacterales bacterium]|nr:class I SAM-dependent methyltransferase [Vicinamibacterales bacterium]HPW21197.1 class I SAM-dependent methyltransferase [Vicinamibacterales bacterium]